ncbi:MAG: UDP-3-O-(3-hydroxymyristoyl)glucosamine N-acyltransferase [Planctomycetes bacterium]|nr:UDP-3-O-(3-hydroxymyristoyl)glucosamine N-acyltransferase [Planctomycetota bacterium]
MNFPTLGQLAQRVGGEVQGLTSLPIHGVAALHKAGANDITFAADEKHLRLVSTSAAGACLLPRNYRGDKTAGITTNLVFVDDPQDACLTLAREFRPQQPPQTVGLSAAAHIAPTARIGQNTQIYPGVFIDEHVEIGDGCVLYPGVFVGHHSRIGNHCTLYPHVVLYPDVHVGNRVILHASAVLGADGFGYRFRNGRFDKIPQLGWVEVEDDCEIGASTTIDRGMLGPTIIGEGTKLDNLVMIGHNCELGKHNAFASQVGLAGSVTTGDYVRCAGQVGVADHVHLGRGCTLGAKAGIHKSIPDGDTQIGYPARPEQEQLKIVMATARLPEMRKTLRDLESRVEEIDSLIEQLTTQGSSS